MAGIVVNCRLESRDENSTGELEMSMKRLFDLIHLRITTLLTKRRFIGMCGALFLLVCCLGRRVTAQSQDVTLVGAADIGGGRAPPPPLPAPTPAARFHPGRVILAGAPGELL